ncbi:MAG: GAF domain-containing protein [Chloroflexota bacterium]
MKQYRSSLRLAGLEIENRNKVIKAITTFSYQASRLTDPATLLEFALKQSLAVTKAQGGAIVLIEPDSQKLTLGTHKGLASTLVNVLTGKCFNTEAVILMTNLVNGKGVLLEQGPSSSQDEVLLLQTSQINSLVSLPLQVGDQLLGALVAVIRDKVHFSPADLHGLLAVAQVTAVALTSLHLREKLWHMAETLLTSKHLPANTDLRASLQTTENLPIIPPLQAHLAQAITTINGSMGIVFTIRHTSAQPDVILAAGYGLSPLFTSSFARLPLSNQAFPFRSLLKQNLLIKNLLALPNNFPLLTGLVEEGARSLLAACFHQQAEFSQVILVAAAEPDAFTADYLPPLHTAARKLLPLLKNLPSVPTLPTHNIHIPPLARQASDDDLEQLLGAVMAAEEEVERHTTDLATLNSISNLLTRTLNVTSVLDQVLAQTSSLLQTELSWLYVVDASPTRSPRLRLQAHDQLNKAYRLALSQISWGDGLEGSIARHNKAVYLHEIAVTDRRCHALLALENVQAVAAVPLTCPEKRDGQEEQHLVGVLCTAMRCPHDWQPRQVRLLDMIANQLAFALNNAQHYTEVKERAENYSVSIQFLKEMNQMILTNQQPNASNG